VKQSARKGRRKCGRKGYAFFVLPESGNKKHFILECEAFKDTRESYTDMMTTSSWDNLFSERFVKKLRAFIMKLYRKKAKYIKHMKKQSIPYVIFKLKSQYTVSTFTRKEKK